MNKTSICYCRLSPLRGAQDRLSGVTSRLAGGLEKAREGDTLTFWPIDRLGGQHFTCCKTSINSIGFQSMMDGIDTNTAAGRMVFSMVGAIA
jgi:DNA invertase Pin-like site-specific DNA recombinase